MKTFLQKTNRIPVPAQMFLLAFLMYVICVLPVLIMHGGLFFYYGDYNVQQVPFYILAHRAVRSGQLFWTWHLDLGGTVLGNLAFYLMGSPFFWLSVPFPESVVPYIMPFLMALKYATAATLGYLYIRRFTMTDIPARIGGFLFAFSGFNAVNIVFNHFMDAVCFFPLLLMTFDDLMARITGEKHDAPVLSEGRSSALRTPSLHLLALRFALTVTLLAIINYYFFFGMVLFLLMYAVLRYVRRANLHALPRMLLYALGAGVTGMLLAGFFLLPAMEGVSGNTRLSSMLTGYDLLVYPNSRMYGDFLKSAVMTPDIIGRGTLFFSSNVKNSSLAFYLPMFGVSGMFAFFHMTKGTRSWVKKILAASCVIAFIPALNAAFSLFNTTYYARWYYMPVLFACLATALAIERGRPKDLKYGALWQTGLFLGMIAVFFLPSKNDEGELVMFHMSDNPWFLLLDGVVTAVLTSLLLVCVFFLKSRRLRMKTLYILTIVCSVALTMNVLAKGKTLISLEGMVKWKEQMLDTRPELPADGFYRVETDDTATNYEMVWGYPTVHCFLSTVPSEIFSFYRGTADIRRFVESELPLNRPGLRALLSERFYIWNSAIYKDGEFGKGEGVHGFDEIVYEDHGLTVFENKNFIPPGFTFGYYIKESDFDALENKAARDKLLVKALILADEDASRFGHLMRELPESERTAHITELAFDGLCRERAQTSCVRFDATKDGFTAQTAYLEKESLVFFSVPALKGFRVTVDGEETEWIRANYGLMAVPVGAGAHEIEAYYEPAGKKEGRILTVAGLIVVLLSYVVMERVFRRRIAAKEGNEVKDE